MTNLPAGIGPHEGREFDLMRAGLKHVALFSDHVPAGLEDFANDPDFGLLQVRFNFKSFGAYPVNILYRLGHESAAQELLTLVDPELTDFNSDRERRIGQILSYTTAEIDAFLAFASPNGQS